MLHMFLLLPLVLESIYLFMTDFGPNIIEARNCQLMNRLDRRTEWGGGMWRSVFCIAYVKIITGTFSKTQCLHLGFMRALNALENNIRNQFSFNLNRISFALIWLHMIQIHFDCLSFM